MIVWDEPKRLANIAKHRMDFAELDESFFDDAMLVPAREGRWAAIGLHNGKTNTVIFAALGQEAVSVISMRPASDWEKELI